MEVIDLKARRLDRTELLNVSQDTDLLHSFSRRKKAPVGAGLRWMTYLQEELNDFLIGARK